MLMRIFWLNLFLQIEKFTFKGQKVSMAFEDNEICSQGTLYSATENQVTETQKSSQSYLLWFTKNRKQHWFLKYQESSQILVYFTLEITTKANWDSIKNEWFRSISKLASLGEVHGWFWTSFYLSSLFLQWSNGKTNKKSQEIHVHSNAVTYT